MSQPMHTNSGLDDGHNNNNINKNNKRKHDRSNRKATSKRARPTATKPSLDLELATVQYLYPKATPHLRKIHPYYYDFSTYAKGRWLNQPLLAMFDKEFADRPKGYYNRAIQSGLIQVNGQRVSPEYVIRNQDRISHRNHRHEPPVTSAPIRVLAVNSEYCVVDKPPSVPVHPTGRYRHNTLIHLVQYYWDEWTKDLLPSSSSSSSANAPSTSDQAVAEASISQPSSSTSAPPVKHLGPTLYPIHRLDRLTSGVLLLCHSRARIADLTAQFQSKVVGKEYLARVRGHFPKDLDACDAPIRVLHHKLGLSHVHPEGKAASTRFTFVAYREDVDESLVRVRPVTGRTHQIRVHLRHLGFPIANDPVYNNPGHRHVVKDRDAWVQATQLAATAASSNASLSTSDPAEGDNVEVANMQGWQESQISAEDATTQAWVEAVGQAKLTADTQVVGQCADCGSDLLADPQPEDMFLYLHAFKYSVAGDLGLPAGPWVGCKDGITTIRTPVPEWAKEGWVGVEWEREEVGEEIEPVVVRGVGEEGEREGDEEAGDEQ